MGKEHREVATNSRRPTFSRERVEPFLVGLLALTARLGWVFWGRWESADSRWYLRVAGNIANAHVFSADEGPGVLAPTAFRPPLYPAVVAALWFGESGPTLLMLLLQAVLGAATVSLLYLIAREYFGRTIAIVAALGMAVAPMSGRYTAVLLSETLFTFLITLGVFYWTKKRYLPTGLIFGLAALTRVTILPFVVLLPLLSLLPPWRPQRRAYVTIMLLSLAVASVWVVRNAVVFQRFIPVAASGYGTNLLLGAVRTEVADDVQARRAFLKTVDGSSGGEPGETESDRTRLRAAFERIIAAPLEWLISRAQQYPRLFTDSGSYLFGAGDTPFRTALRQHQLMPVLVRTAFIAGNLAVFLCALVGIFAERARFVSLSSIVLFPLFLVVIHLPLWTEPRYGLPMMPLVAIFAAVGAVKLLSYARLKRFFQSKKGLSTRK